MIMQEKTILFVEDNISEVELAKRAFSKAPIGHRLVVVSDGQEALDYLLGTGAHAGRDAFDLPALILLDLKLPKISGLEVLRRIREHGTTRRIPVVIFSSSREESDRAAGYDLGANSYLRKPMHFTELQQQLAVLCAYWLTHNEPPPRASSEGLAPGLRWLGKVSLDGGI
jgi:two-component system response regulator